MNILYGLARPDEGQILLDGQPVDDQSARRTRSPAASTWSTSTSCWSRCSPSPRTSCSARRRWPNPVFLDRREAHQRIAELGRRFGFEIDPDAKVGSLSVGWQQRVEILKALYRNARILVLDEPTAVLTPQETEEIFAVLRRLASEGPLHRLHQPQALRGAGDRRPDHGHPPRPGGGPAAPGRDERGGPRRADGRARGPADRGSWRVASGRAVLRVSGLEASDDRGNPMRPGRRARGPGRRDPRHRRRRRERPGRARRGDHRAAQADGGDGHARSGRTSPGSRPRAIERGPGGIRAGRPPPVWADPLLPPVRQPRPDELSPPAVLARHPAQRRGDRARCRRRRSRSSTSGRRRRPSRRARCRAATNRRRSWRGSSTGTSSSSSWTSRPGASTSAASSSSTARSSRNAMPGRRVLLVSAELDEVLELSDRIAVMFRGGSSPCSTDDRRQERGRPPDGDGRPRPWRKSSRRSWRPPIGATPTPARLPRRPAADQRRMIGHRCRGHVVGRPPPRSRSHPPPHVACGLGHRRGAARRDRRLPAARRS